MTDTGGTNSILKHLIASGDFSEAALKRIFKRLSKKTHPDLTGARGEPFIRLKEEYEEAENFLRKYRRKLDLSRSELRKALFESLEHYTASGLHSQRVRLRPELNERNRALIRRTLDLAQLYDSDFARIFERYSVPLPRSYGDWKREKSLRAATGLFISGLNAFLNFQQTGSPLPKRMAESYLSECLASLQTGDKGGSVADFTRWLVSELELPPVHADNPNEGKTYENHSVH